MAQTWEQREEEVQNSDDCDSSSKMVVLVDLSVSSTINSVEMMKSASTNMQAWQQAREAIKGQEIDVGIRTASKCCVSQL